MNENRTRMIFIMMLVFLGALVFAVVFMPGAKARTITVDDSGGKDYTEIQDAINASRVGDTIYVYNGTYENITISKSINLIGESNQNTIIKGSGIENSNSISILANYVNISNLKIDNFGCGIYLYNSSNNNIISNAIANCSQFGIFLCTGLNNTITSNAVANCDCGIGLISSLSSISSNIVTNCTSGIYLLFCSNNTIASNIIWNNERGVCLDAFFGAFCSNNSITLNNIYNNTEYGLQSKYGSDNTAYNNWWGDATGPYNATTNPNGSGDNITTNGVPFSPWAVTPFNISVAEINITWPHWPETQKQKKSGWFIPGFETVLLIASVSCILLFRKYRRIK